MQKENTLADSPERRGAEHIRPGGALDDIVSQVSPHVVNQQVGVKIDRLVAQGVALDDRRSSHLRSVACDATHGGKEVSATLRSVRERRRLGAVEEPHEEHEFHPVRQQVDRIVEGLVIEIVRINAGNVVRVRLLRAIARVRLFHRLWEQLVRHAHFDVIRLAGENRNGFVLGLPTEAGYCAVVGAAVGNSLDAELRAYSGAVVMAFEYLSILDRINQSHAEHLKWNPKSHVVVGDFPLEIGLLNTAPSDARVISSPDNGEQLMHAAVARAVRFEEKPDFSDRAELRDKRRYSVGRALAVWNQVEHRILRR